MKKGVNSQQLRFNKWTKKTLYIHLHEQCHVFSLKLPTVKSQCWVSNVKSQLHSTVKWSDRLTSLDQTCLDHWRQPTCQNRDIFFWLFIIILYYLKTEHQMCQVRSIRAVLDTSKLQCHPAQVKFPFLTSHAHRLFTTSMQIPIACHIDAKRTSCQCS